MIHSKDFQLPVVHDAAEAQAIVSRLRDIPGVKDALGDHRTKIFVVQWTDVGNWDDIAKTLVEMGYIPKHR